MGAKTRNSAMKWNFFIKILLFQKPDNLKTPNGLLQYNLPSGKYIGAETRERIEPGTNSSGKNIVADRSRSGASVRRCKGTYTGTIELLEPSTEVLELKESLTEDNRQSPLRMSGLLGNVTSDFNKFHFTLVDSIEMEEDA